MKMINAIAKSVYANAVDRGFWDCPVCDGRGALRATNWNDTDVINNQTTRMHQVDCATCNGTGKHRNIGESLALIHSEVSEALEAKRDPKDDDLCDKCDGQGEVQSPKATMAFNLVEPCQKCGGTGHAMGGSRFGEELADVVIRVMDLAVAEGIDLEATILAKHAYNTTRPRKHGKKF